MEQLPFKEAIKVWIRVAIYSFGGPAGQIAVMHKILVEEKKWISENRFLHALNYCMLLPGPEAQQLATYIGWLLHRTKGGVTAGILFVIPGFVSILILSILYAAYRDVGIVEAIFFGIKPAVLAIVVGAVIKIGKKAIKNELMFVLAALAFIAIFFFEVDFPYIIIAAGLTGFIGGKLWEEKFHVIKGHRLAEEHKDKDNNENDSDSTLIILIICLSILVVLIVFAGILYMLRSGVLSKTKQKQSLKLHYNEEGVGDIQNINIKSIQSDSEGVGAGVHPDDVNMTELVEIQKEQNDFKDDDIVEELNNNTQAFSNTTTNEIVVAEFEQL